MNDKIRAILEKINEEPSQEGIKNEAADLISPIVEPKDAKPLKTVETKIVKTVGAAPIVEKKAKTEKKVLLADGGKGEGFLANVVNEAFSYEKRKYAFIEPRLFELFMQVKIRKDIKNISVIVNSILNEYVEKHQDEIKKLLENKF